MQRASSRSHAISSERKGNTMADVASGEKIRTLDRDLRRRAATVIPGGMYGHMSVNYLPDAYPQFYERSEGTRVWDVDGNEYVDFMCSFGPMILGYKHPGVEAAAAAQAAKGDTQSGPAACMVELAELLVERVAHADWTIFAKNGTDATTISLMVARAETGRNKVLAAKGAYHGSAPWATIRMDGVAPEERATLHYYEYNDAASVERAIEQAGAGDVAAIITSPFKHHAGFDQEPVDPAFARRLRELCDELANEIGVPIRQTGPVQMPNLSFPDDQDYAKAIAFCTTMLERGVIVHPRHNWFLSAAHTDDDIDRFLDAAQHGLEAVLA